MDFSDEDVNTLEILFGNPTKNELSLKYESTTPFSYGVIPLPQKRHRSMSYRPVSASKNGSKDNEKSISSSKRSHSFSEVEVMRKAVLDLSSGLASMDGTRHIFDDDGNKMFAPLWYEQKQSEDWKRDGVHRNCGSLHFCNLDSLEHVDEENVFQSEDEGFANFFRSTYPNSSPFQEESPSEGLNDNISQIDDDSSSYDAYRYEAKLREREQFKIKVEEDRKWLEEERLFLVALSKETKHLKKLVPKLQASCKALCEETKALKLVHKAYEDKVIDFQGQIRSKKKLIRRLIKYFDQVKAEKGVLRKQLKDEREALRKAKEHCEALHGELGNIQFRFDEVGVDVKHHVDLRTKLHHELDLKRAHLVQLHVDDVESEIDNVDYDDPLVFIESNYPFFQDVEKCTVDEIGNVEDPRKCMDAMDEFVKVLKQNLHRFKHMPRGPLFHCIVVKNKKWSPIVEYVLRPYLFSFLVDNLTDSLVMDEIIEEHFPGGRPGIVNNEGVIVPKHHTVPFNSSYVVGERITAMTGLELENMLESIHSEDDIWAKFLSMVISAEKIIFMDNENIAFLVLSHIKNSPWDCRMAYTMDGFKVYPFPGFRTKQIRLYQKSMYLKCWPDLKIGEIISAIRKITRNIDDHNETILAQRTKQLTIAGEIDSMRLNIKEVAAQKLVCRAMIKETKSLLNEPMSTFFHKKALKHLKTQLKKMKKCLIEAKKQIKIKDAELVESKAELKKESVRLEDLSSTLVLREDIFFTMKASVFKREDKLEARRRIEEYEDSFSSHPSFQSFLRKLDKL